MKHLAASEYSPGCEQWLERDFYPPGGGRIAFSSDRDANYEIYVMNADGSGQTNLTNNPAGDGPPT